MWRHSGRGTSCWTALSETIEGRRRAEASDWNVDAKLHWSSNSVGSVQLVLQRPASYTWPKIVYADDICLAVQGQYFSELECSLSSDMAWMSHFCRQWWLTPSASKTISSVFHLHNTSATRELEMWVRGHSWSLKVVPFETIGMVSYSHSIVTMAISLTILETHSIKEWPDLEIWLWGHSRSLKKLPFNRPFTTFYWSAIVTIVVSCTVLHLFDVK